MYLQIQEKNIFSRQGKLWGDIIGKYAKPDLSDFLMYLHLHNS